MSETIKDSGSMQEFSTGAHRDDSSSKGDCSLLPLKYVAMLMDDPVIASISRFMDTRDISHLTTALAESTKTLKCFNYQNIHDMLLNEFGVENELPDDSLFYRDKAALAHMMIEVSKIYQAGAEKYGRHNWKLGMPVDRYIDSGVRHYFKTLRGDIDEPHYRGFVWNLLCAMWTTENLPEMIDHE